MLTITSRKLCVCLADQNNINLILFHVLNCLGIKLKCVPTYKYLGVHIATDQKYHRSTRQQCRNMYSTGNTIIKKHKHCSDAIKCQLFKSFCTRFYCASLWSSYAIESLHHLKVAYNRIFPYPYGYAS